MKTIPIVSEKKLSSCLKNSWLLFFTLILVIPVTGLSQIRNKDVLRQAAIKEDRPVNVLIKERNLDQFREVQVPISEFKMSPGVNTAVVKGTEIRNFESNGHYIEQNELKNLNGWVLDEVIISRMVNEEVPVALQILVDTNAMLFYNRAENKFEGTLNITLLSDAHGVLESKQLVEPVLIELTSGSGARINPQSTFISHTNLPSTNIAIVDVSPQSQVPVNIKTAFNPAGYLKILRKEPLLSIETPSKRLQGLGVQAIPVKIALLGEARSGPVNVSIVTDNGTVEPDNIDISGDRAGTVMLRSEGVGNANLTVTAAGFSNDTREFYFTFPWVFILFPVLGGFLGAVVKYLMMKEKVKFQNVLVLGLITGLITSVLYYVLGIQVFSFKFSQTLNEFAVLGFAFLGALFWDTIYTSLSKLAIKT